MGKVRSTEFTSLQREISHKFGQQIMFKQLVKGIDEIGRQRDGKQTVEDFLNISMSKL